MKKILTVLLLTCSMSAMAQHGHHGGHRGGYNSWVAPIIIGGAIGYSLTRNYYDPYYSYAPPPVVYVPPSPIVVYAQQNTINNAPIGYHWQEMIDPQSGVRKIVAVPN